MILSFSSAIIRIAAVRIVETAGAAEAVIHNGLAAGDKVSA